jgi:hypothetical protein
MVAIQNIQTGDVPANSTQIYQGKLVDYQFIPVLPNMLNSLTLTIVDTQTGNIINNCDEVDILNVPGDPRNRTLDNHGTFTVTLLPADTAIDDNAANRVQRSLVFEFTYNYNASVGRHQANFYITRLAGR